MLKHPNGLLLVLSVCFKRSESGELMLEKQTCNGIDLWAKNFDFVVVACPILSSADGEKTLTTVDYVCASQLKSSDRVELVPLPYAYHAVDFFLRLEPTREILATKIRECRYLCFAIGGLIGDWPTVAALEAIRQMRPYSVWTDRVEHVVVKTSYTDRSGGRRLYRFLRDGVLSSPVMKQVQKYIISKSSLGLFHGGECLAAYGKFCKAPHLVHDIHLSVADLVSDGQFAAKANAPGARIPA